MKTRKLIALAMAVIMVFALLAACGDKENSGDVNTPPANSDGGQQNQAQRYSNTRTIELGIWWDPKDIYDSNRRTIPDSEKDLVAGQMRLENMRAIEERYNVRLEFVNMTFNGARESISTSVMAGSPDVDIYYMDLNFALPFVLNNYCLPVSSYTSPTDDVQTDQFVLAAVNLCGLPENYVFRQTPLMDYNAVYMLGYNWDLLQQFNQPNPQDLWDEGKWTWSAWLDIMKATTDSTQGTWGWVGTHIRLLDNLLMSNGTGIAIEETQTIDTSATLEVFEFIYDMYNVSNVAREWRDGGDWWADNNDWSEGTNAFFIWVPWLAQNYGITKGYPTADYEDCEYVIRVVPWPTGPSGNPATNGGVNLNGNVVMIPKGAVDPEILYKVYYDYCNWYGYDKSAGAASIQEATDLRNEAALWIEDYYGDDERGLAMMMEVAEKPQLDLWDIFVMRDADGSQFSAVWLFSGDWTPAQLAESWKNIVQDYLDVAYGKK